MELNEPVILFDGVCNLCNGIVRFVLKNEKNNHFKFAALQSKTGQRLLEQYSVKLFELETLVLIQNGKVFTRSDAALAIAASLRFPFHWVTIFSILPKKFRDRLYDWIAAHRYQFFGKQKECMVPKPEWRSRFLED